MPSAKWRGLTKNIKNVIVLKDLTNLGRKKMAADTLCNCKMNVEKGHSSGNEVVTMILAILTQEFLALPEDETFYELEVSPLEGRQGFTIKVLDSMPANISLAIEAQKKKNGFQTAEEAASGDFKKDSWPIKGRAFLRNQTAKGLGGIPIRMLTIVADTANLLPDEMIYAVRVYPGKAAFTLCFEIALSQSSAEEMRGLRADQRYCRM